MRRVGILGGTFNPPHLGHVALARSAREELGLERVVLMPAHSSPHKAAAEDSGPAHRLNMCRAVVADVESMTAEGLGEGPVGDVSGLSVCALEIEREGPSYTVDTLRAIHASHPDAQLTFIVGADTARTLPTWREPGELLELADLAVAARAGSTGRREVLESVAPLIGEAAGPVGLRFLKMPAMEVSSSLVRERVTRQEPIEMLVGRAVAAYIEEHDLYRGDVADEHHLDRASPGGGH